MDKGGGQRGSITIFFQKLFALTLPKNFVKEPFRVSLFFGTEKVCEEKLVGGVSKLSVESFCLTVSKISVGGNPLVFH